MAEMHIADQERIYFWKNGLAKNGFLPAKI
jgi:hypothetical protein